VRKVDHRLGIHLASRRRMASRQGPSKGAVTILTRLSVTIERARHHVAALCIMLTE